MKEKLEIHSIYSEDTWSSKGDDPNRVAWTFPFLTLHLHQELGLDPASRLALVLAPGAAQRVDLIDEDDGWTVFSGQLEQILHQPEGKRNNEGKSGRDALKANIIDTIRFKLDKKKQQ